MRLAASTRRCALLSFGQYTRPSPPAAAFLSCYSVAASVGCSTRFSDRLYCSLVTPKPRAQADHSPSTLVLMLVIVIEIHRDLFSGSLLRPAKCFDLPVSAHYGSLTQASEHPASQPVRRQ